MNFSKSIKYFGSLFLQRLFIFFLKIFYLEPLIFLSLLGKFDELFFIYTKIIDYGYIIMIFVHQSNEKSDQFCEKAREEKQRDKVLERRRGKNEWENKRERGKSRKRNMRRLMRDRKVTVILSYGPLGPEMYDRVKYNNKFKTIGLKCPFM